MYISKFQFTFSHKKIAFYDGRAIDTFAERQEIEFEICRIQHERGEYWRGLSLEDLKKLRDGLDFIIQKYEGAPS